MNINDENIDELMFQLLEGEIQGEEREKLLEAIQADKAYSKQWDAWQQTILDPGRELIVMDTGKLLKKQKRHAAVWWKYSAAAMALLVVGVGIYLIRTSQSTQPGMAGKPGDPKTHIIKVPSVPPVNPDTEKKDTVLSLKQKVEMMADKSNRGEKHDNKGPNENMELEKEIEQPLIADKSSEKKDPEIPVNVVRDITPTTGEPAYVTAKDGAADVIMTVYTEPGSGNSRSPLKETILDKRNKISRIFSKPKLMIVSDSNTLTNRKIIIENKEYKIIAGF